MRPQNLNDLLGKLEKEESIDLPMDEAFYERLHDKIMTAVEQTEVKPKTRWEKPRKLLQAHWRGWLYTSGSLMTLVLVAILVAQQQGNVVSKSHIAQVAKNEEQILSKALESPDAFSQTLISHQSSSDFLVDVADRSFDDLSEVRFKKIMGEDRL